MDLRERAARERNCREELRLNRRLAPEIYVDVVPLCQQADQSLKIGGQGIAVDWLVKMRRLPAHRMLNEAIAAQGVTERDVQCIAQTLARFFCDQVPAILSGADYLARMHAHVDDTESQLLSADLQLNADVVELAITRQRAFLIAQPQMFQDRASEGRVIEGHGDLRPEHVFLGSARNDKTVLSPCIIDCLEFDRDLRVLDAVEELAFLSLECDRLNADWVGKEFVKTYRAMTEDAFASSLFRFYRSERALTRAKVAAWHLRDPDVADLADWRELANSYLHNALETAEIGD
jgi:aminoglycoside phosphotransferase family enzyme